VEMGYEDDEVRVSRVEGQGRGELVVWLVKCMDKACNAMYKSWTAGPGSPADQQKYKPNKIIMVQHLHVDCTSDLGR